MMLNELTGVPQSALPVQAMSDHLRLGSGFADDGLQAGLVETYLRSALAAIEGRIGKALLQRSFRLSLAHWRSRAGQALPLAPVSSVNSVTLIDAQGAASAVPADRYRLAEDMHRPRLMPRGTRLPAIPHDGRVEIVFDAGFGTNWGDVPPDLAQAVFLLAAQYYERRHDADGVSGGLSRQIQALTERWRNIRVLGGGTA